MWEKSENDEPTRAENGDKEGMSKEESEDSL
jgi:hypothetical protein